MSFIYFHLFILYSFIYFRDLQRGCELQMLWICMYVYIYTYMYVCVCLCVCVCVCVYTYAIEMYICIYIYIYIYMHIYMYMLTGFEGATSGPPAAREYAVEPVGVAMMIPSA